MDFPETSMAYMGYIGIVLFFFKAGHISLILYLCFFQDQRRTLATQG